MITAAMVTAAALFIASSALQLLASRERWVLARADLPADDVTYENHLYDYVWPAEPWQNVGVAAELAGIAILALAAGFAVLSYAVPAAGRSWTIAAILTVVLPLAVTGTHAIVSGIAGAPSPLAREPILAVLTLLPFLGLVAVAIRWAPRAPLAALACLPLLAMTMPGYLLALFVVAPVLAGYSSHDTTPGTEAIVAVCVALAALPLLGGAIFRGFARRRAVGVVG